MKISAQDVWKHITHLITLWEDPWSPQNCSKIPKWKMQVVSAWVPRVQWPSTGYARDAIAMSSSRMFYFLVWFRGWVTLELHFTKK